MRWCTDGRGERVQVPVPFGSGLGEVATLYREVADLSGEVADFRQDRPRVLGDGVRSHRMHPLFSSIGPPLRRRSRTVPGWQRRDWMADGPPQAERALWVVSGWAVGGRGRRAASGSPPWDASQGRQGDTACSRRAGVDPKTVPSSCTGNLAAPVGHRDSAPSAGAPDSPFLRFPPTTTRFSLILALRLGHRAGQHSGSATVGKDAAECVPVLEGVSEPAAATRQIEGHWNPSDSRNESVRLG